MKCRFMISGYATGGDKADVKMWLEDSIKQYDVMPKVVDSFDVDVEEIEKHLTFYCKSCCEDKKDEDVCDHYDLNIHRWCFKCCHDFYEPYARKEPLPMEDLD